MVEDYHEDGEKTDSTVVVTLEGERREHVEETGNAKAAHRTVEGGRWCIGRPYLSYILTLRGG